MIVCERRGGLRLGFLVGLLFVAFTPALAGGIEVSTALQPDPRDIQFNDIAVTVRQDRLTIDHVLVNRGYCKPIYVGSAPRMLIFGQTLLLRAFPCIPAEVEVVANEGSATFGFDEPADDETIRIKKIKLAYGVNQLRVFSYVDTAIKEIVVNRGVCGKDGHIIFDPPRKLHFGEYVTTGGLFCEPIEAKIETDTGPVTMRWGK